MRLREAVWLFREVVELEYYRQPPCTVLSVAVSKLSTVHFSDQIEAVNSYFCHMFVPSYACTETGEQSS